MLRAQRVAAGDRAFDHSGPYAVHPDLGVRREERRVLLLDAAPHVEPDHRRR